MKRHPVVIIGAGPSGLACAMQLQRQGIPPLVLERGQVGGLLLNANWVENYPGFVEGITGPALADLFAEQARRLGVKIDREEVRNVRFDGDVFRIGTDQRHLSAAIVVAATGTKARELSPGLVSGNAGDRIKYEVFPLIGQKGKDIVIIGAGDAAFDYALNLAKENQVFILNRGREIKALNLLVERAKKEPAIHYADLTEIRVIDSLESGRLHVAASAPTGELDLECDYLLAAIGREPEYSFADPSIMEAMEKLLKDEALFLIGDLQNGSFRQTSIAVADGIRTAMKIAQILEKG